MNILVTGASGLVGSNFLKQLSKQKECRLIGTYQHHPLKFSFCENTSVDITDREAALRLERYQPELILHCAALANIAQCEAHPEFARQINVEGTKNIAALAKNTGAKLVYISTDAVFDGQKGNYTEADSAHPQTVYGKTKLGGEVSCLTADADCLITRISIFGKNHCTPALSFVESILDKLGKRECFQGFVDATYSPMYALYTLETIMELVFKKAKGLFHVTGSEMTSKFEFAKKVARIFRFDEKHIQPSSIEKVSGEIAYPRNVGLDNSKMLRLLNRKLPSLDQMLTEFYMEVCHD